MEQTSRIDRLSALPNDVLAPIFQLAHENHLPKGPLSKRLLPFYEKNIWREIRFTSNDQADSIAASLIETPRLKHLVESLSLDRWSDVSYEEEEDALVTSLPLLPSLRTLDLRRCPEVINAVSQIFTYLPCLQNLRSLAIQVPSTYVAEDPVQRLGFIANLPSLHTLDIYGVGEGRAKWDITAQLENVRTLGIEGREPDENLLVEIIKRCPNLSSFTLSMYDLNCGMETLLQQIPTGLEEMQVFGDPGGCRFTREIPVLPDFRSLTRLVSRGQVFSTHVYLVLLQLPQLVTISLSDVQIDEAQFERLVAGPERLLHLRTLELNTWMGHIGHQYTSPFDRGLVWPVPGEKDPLQMDWHLPSWICLGGFNAQQLRHLVQVGKENGVSVKGSGIADIELADDYWIEANNRAVLHAHFSNDLEPWKKVLRDAKRHGSPLPDPGQLDSDQPFEIVETELPAKDWFLLSIRNEQKEGVGEERGDVGIRRGRLGESLVNEELWEEDVEV